MQTLMNRVLMAYRPLQLRGLLLDGQYKLPAAQPAADPAPAASRPRRHVLLAALTGLRAFSFLLRSKP